jgi:hypothetical protein
VELELDGVPLADAPSPLPIPTDFYAYPLPPALLTIGSHVILGRVCRAEACGEWAGVTIEITPIAPGILRDLHVRPGEQPVDVPAAIEMAHAYGVLVDNKRLTDSALEYLATRYLERFPDRVLSRGRILSVFDSEYRKVPK